MAKAHVTTKNGTSITIEGTPSEVAKVVAQLRGDVPFKREIPRTSKGRRSNRDISARSKSTPANLIAELIDGGFFKKPKQLAAIKNALEEQGHYYPVTTLSPTMLRFVRRRGLRRIKDNKRWLYVGG